MSSVWGRLSPPAVLALLAGLTLLRRGLGRRAALAALPGPAPEPLSA